MDKLKELEKLIHMAQKRAVNCILSDIEFGYDTEMIKNKIKGGAYVGDSIETFNTVKKCTNASVTGFCLMREERGCDICGYLK